MCLTMWVDSNKFGWKLQSLLDENHKISSERTKMANEMREQQIVHYSQFGCKTFLRNNMNCGLSCHSMN